MIRTVLRLAAALLVLSPAAQAPWPGLPKASRTPRSGPPPSSRKSPRSPTSWSSGDVVRAATEADSAGQSQWVTYDRKANRWSAPVAGPAPALTHVDSLGGVRVFDGGLFDKFRGDALALGDGTTLAKRDSGYALVGADGADLGWPAVTQKEVEMWSGKVRQGLPSEFPEARVQQLFDQGRLKNEPGPTMLAGGVRWFGLKGGFAGGSGSSAASCRGARRRGSSTCTATSCWSTRRSRASSRGPARSGSAPAASARPRSRASRGSCCIARRARSGGSSRPATRASRATSCGTSPSAPDGLWVTTDRGISRYDWKSKNWKSWYWRSAPKGQVSFVLSSEPAGNLFDQSFTRDGRRPPARVPQAARLRSGDTVAVVAPAGPVPVHRLQQGIRTLERLGFDVRLGAGVLAQERYLAGPDDTRARSISCRCGRGATSPRCSARAAAMARRASSTCSRPRSCAGIRRSSAASPTSRRCTPRARAPAWCRSTGRWWRGTWRMGAARGRVRARPRSSSRARPRSRAAAGSTRRRSVPCSWTVPPCVRDRAALRPSRSCAAARRAGLLGGCLSLLVATIGTPEEVDTRGSILVLEDEKEPPYRVDRMLTQLRRAGKFDGVRGIVLGDFPECDARCGRGLRAGRRAARPPRRPRRAGGVAVPDRPHAAAQRRRCRSGVRATLDAGRGRIVTETAAVR